MNLRSIRRRGSNEAMGQSRGGAAIDPPHQVLITRRNHDHRIVAPMTVRRRHDLRLCDERRRKETETSRREERPTSSSAQEAASRYRPDRHSPGRRGAERRGDQAGTRSWSASRAASEVFHASTTGRVPSRPRFRSSSPRRYYVHDIHGRLRPPRHLSPPHPRWARAAPAPAAPPRVSAPGRPSRVPVVVPGSSPGGSGSSRGRLDPGGHVGAWPFHRGGIKAGATVDDAMDTRGATVCLTRPLWAGGHSCGACRDARHAPWKSVRRSARRSCRDLLRGACASS